MSAASSPPLIQSVRSNFAPAAPVHVVPVVEAAAVIVTFTMRIPAAVAA